jgi:hypothetical protein
VKLSIRISLPVWKCLTNLSKVAPEERKDGRNGFDAPKNAFLYFTFLSPEKFQNRKERNRLRVLVSYVGDYLSELGFGEG